MNTNQMLEEGHTEKKTAVTTQSIPSKSVA